MAWGAFWLIVAAILFIWGVVQTEREIRNR